MYGVFHPCDRNYLTILEHMYEQNVSEASRCPDEKSIQHWNDALKIGEEILLGYRTVYPRYDVNTALMALKLGKIASYMENNTKARGKYIASILSQRKYWRLRDVIRY